MKRIALVLDTEIGYCRQVVLGILDFAVERPDWIFHHTRPQNEIGQPLAEWGVDGIITHIFDPEVERELSSLKKPLVNTTATLPQSNMPLVETDHLAVGRMAADYFLYRGFWNFGYFGSAWTGFSVGRLEGYSKRLAEAGFEVSVRHSEYLPVVPPRANWTKAEERTRKWLVDLPKPVSIFASNDVPARDLSDLCRLSNLKIPDQVALLGVDNDQCVCRMTNPAISSIQLPAQKIGFEAASRLEALLSGKALETSECLLPPVRVVTRASTDIVATPDEAVSRALSYIRLRYTDELPVEEIAHQSGISRRVLERRFAKLLNRTIFEEIQLVRVRRAKELLAETKHPISVVAERSGFSESRRMALAFRKTESCTPTEFRQKAQQQKTLPR